MDTKVNKMAGLAPLVHFVSETSTPIKEDRSPSTSGIEDDSNTSTPFSSNFSLISNDEKEKHYDKEKNAIVACENQCEVKFALDDKDSIISSSESSDDEDDFTVNEKKPKIPDGGWGWMVVLASLIISMIADGISFSFGLLYIEFLTEFNESKSKTSWIGSLFMAGK